MEKIINSENYRSFAYVNDGIIDGKIKGVVVRFHGLGGQEMFDEETNEGKFFAERGILYVVPYQNPWAWMNKQNVGYTDEIVDALFEKYSLSENTPIAFYYSVNSDKFHVADCYHLYSIVDKFLKTSTSVPDLVADGYSPCRDCIVVEEESNEDDSNKITKEEATFVIGTGNNKLHTLDCHNVRSIQEKHLEYTNLTIEELMEIDKYTPCKDCLPDEAKIYYQKHPEKDPSNND